MVEKVKNTIIAKGIQPKYVDIKVTETAVMTNVQVAIDVLKKFREFGIQISIDDFGSGYTSLGYLKKLPIDALKIDQSFISSMHNSKDEDTAIANIVIDLGHKLGMKVIAEGVETQEQIDLLKDYACDKIQGYIISEPVNEIEFNLLLDKHSK